MKPNFQTALLDIGHRVDWLLEHESLPALVSPPYLREAVTAYPTRGGKRLRPALLTWTCGLVGGDPGRALHAALAVELYHNWTLVHDDIIDRDETRRGQPACHVLLRDAFPGPRRPAATAFGVNMAILAGDIQQSWAVDALSRATLDGVAPDVVQALVARLCGWVTPSLISGEAMDVEFPFRENVTPDEAERMMVLKTGVLLQFAAETGAMIGLDSAEHLRAEVVDLGHFAVCAGVAFQLLDDLLGMFGDERQTGKPAASDLREGKKTLLYLTALRKTTGEDRRVLAHALGRKRLSAADIDAVRSLLRRCGAEKAIRRRAEGQIKAARDILRRFPANRYRHLLEDWLDYIVARNS